MIHRGAISVMKACRSPAGIMLLVGLAGLQMYTIFVLASIDSLILCRSVVRADVSGTNFTASPVFLAAVIHNRNVGSGATQLPFCKDAINETIPSNSDDPAPMAILSADKLYRRPNFYLSCAVASPGYLLDLLTRSIIAFLAIGEGPCGFSFELNLINSPGPCVVMILSVSRENKSLLNVKPATASADCLRS